MIHHVQGRLADKPPGRAVVDLGGLGLELLVSQHTWGALGSPGTEVHLLAHLAVREDAWTLFGFASEDERSLFRLLLAVQGVGPRMALAVLSGLAPVALRRAIADGDLAALTGVSGVGRKLAQRIVVDLKERIGEPVAAEELARLTGPGVSHGDEAVDALVALGYSAANARDAVLAARSAAADESVEGVLKEALRRL